MDYRVISADSHVDMTWLPGDLFVSQAPSEHKDAVPVGVQTAKGPKWTAGGVTLVEGVEVKFDGVFE